MSTSCVASRYTRRFKELPANGKKAFVPFTVLGWPSRERCLQTLKAMVEEGATALELGIAFSDPVADGPIIQKAAFDTLESGFTLDDAFELVREFRASDSDTPIGLLTYLNPVLAKGADSFFQAAANAGIDSVLIADLPPGEADTVKAAADKAGVSLVFIISPLTSDERLASIAALSTSYLYVVSRLGITGTNEDHDMQLGDLLHRARRLTQLPLLVGFGVSSVAAARKMIDAGADGVITGSKLIEFVDHDESGNLRELREFLKDMTANI